MVKWERGEIGIWQNGNMTKWEYDEMGIWRNGNMVKWKMDFILCDHQYIIFVFYHCCKQPLAHTQQFVLAGPE
jgi:hypothetical protein